MDADIAFVQKVFPNAEIIDSGAEYEYFHALIDGVRMIFYPYRVKGTGNVHTRVRNGTPMKKAEFESLAVILNKRKKTFDCTFHVTNMGIVGLRDDKILPQHMKYMEVA